MTRSGPVERITHADTRGGIRWWECLGWAYYLACSWTWVIGMLLPTILMRDFGPRGWWMFAVPNVIGAAAVGWSVIGPRDGFEFLKVHRTAVSWFSIVTIAFHGYAIAWLFGGTGIAVVTGLVVMGMAVRGGAAWRRLGCLVWFVSAGLLVAMLGNDGMATLPPPRMAADAVWFAPAYAFGFLLCPHLDPTFQRVRGQLRSGESKLSFGVGFGVFFLLMIVGSVLYAGSMSQQWRSGQWPGGWWGGVFAHLAIQSAFTVAAQIRAVCRSPLSVSPFAVMAAAATATAAGVLVRGDVVRLAWFEPLGWFGLSSNEMTAGEWGYRVFLLMYGLWFPTWLLFDWIAGPDRLGRPSLWLATALVASVPAVPAFLGQSTPWLWAVYGSLTTGVIAQVWRRRVTEIPRAPSR